MDKRFKNNQKNPKKYGDSAFIAPTYQMLTTQIPLNYGRLHFIGIGGIGMSGIAEILLNLGYAISGSDISENSHVKRLKMLGINIATTHRAKNVSGAGVVVVSTAITTDNIEYRQARKLHIPILHRAQMLAEIMRLKLSIAIGGTHGKTTTTSLIGHSLQKASMIPTVINGGIINSLGTNVCVGAGRWLVTEADESDGTFCHLPATIVVVTNIDKEHIDHHGDFASLKDVFRSFVNNIPFYGCAVLCADHPQVQKLARTITERRIVTYGLHNNANVRGKNIRQTDDGTFFDVAVHNGPLINDVFIALYGTHNVQNTLASIAVNIAIGINEDAIKSLYLDFKGVNRRFTKTGTFRKATVIDDYAHHPVEIKAVLQTARSIVRRKGIGRVIVIKQPHRYTRVRDLFDDFVHCFEDADHLLVTPIYPAGESPIDGICHKNLVRGIKKLGYPPTQAVENYQAAIATIHRIVQPDDIILFLGAGDITTWAGRLPRERGLPSEVIAPPKKK